jgi:hypothetical protein
VSILGNAWRAIKKAKARDFIKAAEAVARFLKIGRKKPNG